MRDNMLDPFNHYAYAELLMKQQEELINQWKLVKNACEYLNIVKEQIDEIAKLTQAPTEVNLKWEVLFRWSLSDKWNNK
jgi:hypothetical protein